MLLVYDNGQTMRKQCSKIALALRGSAHIGHSQDRCARKFEVHQVWKKQQWTGIESGQVVFNGERSQLGDFGKLDRWDTCIRDGIKGSIDQDS